MSKTRWITTAAGTGLLTLALAPGAGAQTIKREPITPMSGVSGGASFKGTARPATASAARATARRRRR